MPTYRTGGSSIIYGSGMSKIHVDLILTLQRREASILARENIVRMRSIRKNKLCTFVRSHFPQVIFGPDVLTALTGDIIGPIAIIGELIMTTKSYPFTIEFELDCLLIVGHVGAA